MRLRERLNNLDFKEKESIFHCVFALILSGMLIATVGNLLHPLIFFFFPIYYFGGIYVAISLYVQRREKLGKYLTINSWFYCFLPSGWREENILFKKYTN